MTDRLADDAREVVDVLALREALSLGHNYIHAEHLILGMLRQDDSILVEALINLEVGAEDMRRATLRVIQDRLEADAPTRTDVRQG